MEIDSCMPSASPSLVHTLNQLLLSLSQSLATTDISLNEYGVSTLHYKGIVDVTIAVNEKEGKVAFIAVLLSLKHEPRKLTELLYELLCDCYPGNALNGASITIDPQQSTLVPAYHHLISELTTNQFYNVFVNFSELAIKLIKYLKEKQDSAGLLSAESSNTLHRMFR